MYKLFDGKYHFYDNYLKKSDPFVYGYTKYMGRKSSIGTLRTYISFIHKFWLYSLYMPAKENQSFEDYIYEYKNILEKGNLKIYRIKKFKKFKIKLLYKEFNSTNSIKQEMIALKSFFDYILNELKNENYHLIKDIPFNIYGDALNYKKLNISTKYNKGSSYGLKAKGIMRNALATNISIFDDLIKVTKSQRNKSSLGKRMGENMNSKDKYFGTRKDFPLEAFDEFLDSIKNPRDKLLYLFCGITSARFSQALCLTKFDVDLENEKVYLCDPLTNELPVDSNGVVFLNQRPRKELLREYNISFNLTPYNLINFKYSIPTEGEEDRELLFIPGKYKKMFFKLYLEVFDKIDRNNPFIFQTSTGKIYLPSEAQGIFENNLNSFIQNSFKYNKLKFSNKFHVFRHMYGVTMANITYYIQELLDAKHIQNEKKPYIVDTFKLVVSHKMGHGDLKSTDIYFKRSRNKIDNIKKIINVYGEGLLELHESILQVQRKSDLK